MARSIRKKRISETKKELKQKYRSLGSSRRDARRMAAANAPGVYEAEREKKLAENRAKREARRASMASKAKSKKAKGPGKTGLPDVGGPVKVGGKTYSSQAAANAAMERKKLKAESETTKRGLANMRARRSVGIGETYERTEADGTKRKMVKRKQEEDNKAKHGGALAIMIAPVKGKKMKAIKKGAHGAKVKEAMYGAKMKKAMYGAKMKKAEMGAKLKEVPSDNKGLSKLPKEVRNKMGYMKNGGKMSARRKKPTSMSLEKMIEKNDNLNVAKTINQIHRSGMSSDKAKKMIEKLKKRRMMYGGSMKKKMAMGGRMGSKEMMESMKKDDKMLKNGGKVKRNKIKMSREEFRLKQREASMRNELKEKSKNPDSKKRLDAKTQNQLDRAMRANQIKKTKDKAGKGGYDKMMYGGAMKKAMYGAKMKKKAMYGASMKKKAMYGAKMKK